MSVKDTFFCRKKLLNCRGRLLSADQPLVMGVLNVTPDSFFDGGRYTSLKDAVGRALQMAAEGAAIIDIGGCSTRPGAAWPGVKMELDRVLPVISELAARNPELVMAIDTYHPEVAMQAVQAGASIINDISGGTIFPEIQDVAVSLQVPYVLMHIQGTPENMQVDPGYTDVTDEVTSFLAARAGELRKRGLHDIIIDPGFGFGKNTEHNYQLLNQLQDLHILDLPVLTGFSRKRMINSVLGTNPENALTGTTVLNTMALERGADILRVHDVKEAVMAVKIFNFARHTCPQ